MKVSAIMPTYNQAAFIREAVRSVVDQVDELVIVNDGSIDETKLILDELVHPKIVRRRHATNLGTAAAINTGFGATTGELVTWVSSDNIHTPDWREKLEAAFEPDVGAVYSAFRYGLKGMRILYTPYRPGRLINQLACFFGPSFLIRRDVWEETGEHRGLISHDYDHWLRVEETCWEKKLRIVALEDVLCSYRVHDERVTVTRKHQFDAEHWQTAAVNRRAAK